MVAVYIGGQRLDLFQDENIEMNLNAKNVSDISKIFADFSQGFTVPASPNNNAIFTHWYDATVDGTFNANIKAEMLIQLNSMEYKWGQFQLENSKLKNGLPYAYMGTFYGNTVNLTDLFAELELKDLDFSEFDHDYNVTTVIDAMSEDNLSNGDIYYPLITHTGDLNYGTTDDRDLIKVGNTLTYNDFKPALRMIRIIEAVEAKFGITFSRDFFDRAVFYNLFLWLHKDAEKIDDGGQSIKVDFTSKGNIEDFPAAEMNLLGDYYVTGSNTRLYVTVTPSVGYTTVPYKLERYLDDEPWGYRTGLVGTQQIAWRTDNDSKKHSFYVSATDEFKFTVSFEVRQISGATVKNATFNEQTIYGNLIVSANMPQMKITEFFTSLINQFNLIIKSEGTTHFYIDTLDNWYDKGVTYDISKLVDIKDITVKRPDVKKLIDFRYQKGEAILGKRYFDDNQIGYGDLRATFDITGTELKIESQFENMMFERMTNATTGGIVNIQCGLSIDKELKPYKGKPVMFYKNGLIEVDDVMKISGVSVPNIIHTATEDNIDLNQITNSLNFNSDVSSYLYTPVIRSLYFNWWKTYIEDLYNRKTRVLQLECYLPVWILYKLQLNDRFVIGRNKYKISTMRVNLNTGKSSIDVFSDFSSPSDSINDIIPLTVDSTLITVDSDLITVDTTSVHEPVTSYITNGISFSEYESTAGNEHFEVKVSANTSWSVLEVDTGDDIDWFSSNKATGKRSDYLRISIDKNTGAARSGILRFDIGGTIFDLNITQNTI